MPRSALPVVDPFVHVNAVLSGRHTLAIVWAMNKEPSGCGFNLILKHVPGLTPRTLSIRLKDLEKNQLIVKNVTLSAPIRIRYFLSERGRELAMAAQGLAEWGKKFS